ncbi:MAG: hypothetical protein GEV05_04745 [Betaproteobacteria bacterium]|nr:hypothetical protein [Betaproteobacteria bacterium]
MRNHAGSASDSRQWGLTSHRNRGMMRARLACAALVLLLAGCEGLFTGARESVHTLMQGDDGSFAPVRLDLDPDMNPIAFNLRGTTVAAYAEMDRWNSYRATLSLDGAPIATGSFNINNPGTNQMPQGGDFAHTMLIVSVPQAGNYELSVLVAKPKEITIESPRLEVRRNVELPPGTKTQ